MEQEKQEFSMLLRNAVLLFSFIQLNDSEGSDILIFIDKILPDHYSQGLEVSLKNSLVRRAIKRVMAYPRSNELSKEYKKFICFNTTKNRIALYEYSNGKSKFHSYGEDSHVVPDSHQGVPEKMNVKMYSPYKNFETSFKLSN